MSASPIPGPAPVYEDYARCIHCGLCLNACPTYRLWNLEADSPRGRIHQMIQVELGNFPVTDSFVDHIDKCLDCRACETACPSGVEYGKLVEHARARIERDRERSWISRVARDYVFRQLLPNPHLIVDLARVLRLYHRSVLQSIARAAPASLSSPDALPTSPSRDSMNPPSASSLPMAAKSSCPMGSFAAVRFPRTPASAMWPGNSLEQILPSFFAKTLTPSSPTPPVVAPHSRNMIISFRPKSRSSPGLVNFPQKSATSPNFSPRSVSP